MLFPEQIRRFQHVRERRNDVVRLLDGLDCFCRAVELCLDGRLDIIEHLRKAEQVILGFVKLFVNIAEGDQVRRFAVHGFLDFVVQDIAIDFLLVDNFWRVFHQDVSRERCVIFELACRSDVGLVDCAAQPASANLRVDGDGTVGCAVVIAEYALFDLTEFVIRVEVFVGFDKLERCVKRCGFACNRDAVHKAFFAVERFSLVQVVRTVDKVIDPHQQIVGVVRGFEEAWRVLVQLRHEDVAVAP